MASSGSRLNEATTRADRKSRMSKGATLSLQGISLSLRGMSRLVVGLSLLIGLSLLTGKEAIAGNANGLMDISADGHLLACANRDSGTVTIVDLKSHQKKHEVAVGRRRRGSLSSATPTDWRSPCMTKTKWFSSMPIVASRREPFRCSMNLTESLVIRRENAYTSPSIIPDKWSRSIRVSCGSRGSWT